MIPQKYLVWCIYFALLGIVHTTRSRAVEQIQKIPESSVAPWPALTKVDALLHSSLNGLTVVWGDYFEAKWDNPFFISGGQTQELTNTANGNYAIYSVNMGDGVESMMIRFALASGTNPVEFRLQSPTGTLIGSCTLQSTGDIATYRTVGCPMDSSLAKGVKDLVVLFPGTASTMRFNWFAFWARGTTQRIDDILKTQFDSTTNKAAPTLKISGTPVRQRSMLPRSSETLSRAYKMWKPADQGDCPQWMHDTYWTLGQDGKVYSTWHPPVDFNPETGTYCTYGHDHGDDPRGSEVFTLDGWPAFGFVNEHHLLVEGNKSRHEDHFGHKVFVANNWELYNPDNVNELRRCDLVIKFHMGTHSPDALTNTAHEIFLYGRCDGHQPFNLKQFALFGGPGLFKEAEADLCSQIVNSTIRPNPPGQPIGGVHRAIPTRDCYLRGTSQQQTDLALKRTSEFWLTGLTGGSFYFTFLDPSRYFDPSSATKIGRFPDLCRQTGHPLSGTEACQELIAAGSDVTWNDTRSPFRGAVHNNVHFSSLSLPSHASIIMYSDAYGRNYRTSPSLEEGVIFRQLVPTSGFSYRVDGQKSVFPSGDFSSGGKNGVRVPN